MYDKDTLEMARGIFRERGPLYYSATHLFTQDVREAIYILYAFLRITDDIVDVHQKENLTSARVDLEAWKNTWNKLCRQQGRLEESGVHPVIIATYKLKERYSIPDEYFEAFLDVMIQDTVKHSYLTYTELEEYMYGSAACVGGMICYILGFKGGVQTLESAYSLGYAMQLTNFLRDMDEDYQELGRIYIPQEYLDACGVTEEMIRMKTMTSEMEKLIVYVSEKARSLFRAAEVGVVSLEKGRGAVRFASLYYEGILDMLQKPDCDIFHLKRRHPDTREALTFFIQTFTDQSVWKKIHNT